MKLPGSPDEATVATRLRKLAAMARRLAKGPIADRTRQRLQRAAADYERQAAEAERHYGS